MYIRRTLYVHECLNANLHERNTTCVDKVSLKKIMSKQMRISLSRTGAEMVWEALAKNGLGSS